MNSEDWSTDEGVLKMETSEIVTDTNSVCNGEVPVVPVTYQDRSTQEMSSIRKEKGSAKKGGQLTFSVVKNDTLTELMRSVTNELDAVSKRFSISSRFFIPVRRKIESKSVTIHSSKRRREERKCEHVKNPIVDTERYVVTEVVESSSLVLGLSERRLVRLGTDDVLKIGVDVGFIGKDDDFNGRVVLLEFDQFVVTTSNGGFVGSFRDENDEEVSNVVAVNLLAVHSGRCRGDIGSDESDPGEETIG